MIIKSSFSEFKLLLIKFLETIIIKINYINWILYLRDI